MVDHFYKNNKLNFLIKNDFGSTLSFSNIFGSYIFILEIKDIKVLGFFYFSAIEIFCKIGDAEKKNQLFYET